MSRFVRRGSFCVSIILLMASVSGCAVWIKPAELQVPTKKTCITLKEALVVNSTWRLGAPVTLRLEKGPYWSEKIDARGTFYRAPQGGISILNRMDTPTYDGGLYVPDNVDEHAAVYWYFSTKSIPTAATPNEADCSNIVLIKDPSGTKADLIQFAVGGAAAGTAGGIVGRGLAKGSGLSYGQAAGAGAAGGFIGGLAAAAVVNAYVGKIVLETDIKETAFKETIRAATAAKVPLQEQSHPLGLSETESPPSGQP